MAKYGKRLGFLPGWRVFTYVILIVNLIFLIWVIAGTNAAQSDNSHCGTLSATDCQTAKDVGTSIGAALVIVLWAVVDVILGVLWLVTNRKKRRCPVCDHDVKKGVMACRNCGYDFRIGAIPQPAGYGQQPQGQYAQPPQHQYYTPPRQQYEQPPAPQHLYQQQPYGQASVPPPSAPAQRRPGPGPRP